MRLIKGNRLQVKTMKKSESPYWDWVNQHASKTGDGDMLEPVEANPDSIAAYVNDNDKLQAAITVLQEGGESVLSPREKEVFQFVVREGKSMRDVAKQLSVSPMTVSRALKTLGSKLKRLCAAKL